MLKTIWQNLSKIQKIGSIIILQALVILLVASILKSTLRPRDHIEVDDGAEILSNMPSAERELYENELWNVIIAHTEGLDNSIVKEAIIREDSYTEEIDSENGVSKVSFLIDIDSIRQTYKVYAGWTKNEPFTVSPVIECVSVKESKYPDSICFGTYNNTYSLDLYLPWKIESPYKNEYSYAVPEVYIDGDEINHTITAYIVPCNNLEENKKKANNYIQTIPGHDNYKIEYVVGDHVDVVCAEDLQNGT